MKNVRLSIIEIGKVGIKLGINFQLGGQLRLALIQKLRSNESYISQKNSTSKSKDKKLKFLVQ